MWGFVSLVASILVSIPVWAQPASVEKVFAELFHTAHCESGVCGTNVMKLVDQLQRQRVEFARANILKVTSPGFVHLEGLRSYNARNKGRLISSGTFRRDITYPDHMILRTPGETMWYHHVVLAAPGTDGAPYFMRRYLFDFD